MPLRSASRRFRQAVFAIVLLALGLAQTLGAMHRIVHAPVMLHALGAGAAQPATAGPHWLQALFAGHTHEQGCDLYDQLSHADLLGVDAIVVALQAVPDACVAPHRPSRIAAQAAGFLARGPPSVG
jgi:hypothetical protein